MRAIVAHLHSISARLHFWRVEYDSQASVCLPRPLASLSALHTTRPSGAPVPHPAQMVRPVAELLGLAPEQLSVVSMLGWVEMPGEWCPVVLLRIEGNTLPTLQGGEFITLMDLLQLPVTERLLLRAAYEALLEG